MKKLAKLAGVMPFAHLLGVKAARAESDEDDDKKKDDDTSAKAEGEDDDDEAKAEGSDDKPDDEDKKDNESKKAKSKAEDDDSDGDDDERKDEASAAVHAERARCAQIVAHGIKTGAVRQACAYAFNTDMSATVAIETLDATAADRKAGGSTLASRMASEQTAQVRADAGQAEPGSTGATVSAILAAGRKARGEA